MPPPNACFVYDFHANRIATEEDFLRLPERKAAREPKKARQGEREADTAGSEEKREGCQID